MRKLPECEQRFLIAAAKDGVTLVPAPNYEWIGTRGPFGLATQSGPLFDAVLEMAMALDGHLDVMRSPRRTRRADFDLIHELTGTHIEVDEEQHFSTHRLKMLDFYDPELDYGFDLGEYRALCRLHGPRIDRTVWAAKDTVNFGPRSRAKQRAFYDAMKDLVLPTMGKSHVIRIEVIDREPELAWALNRERISAALVLREEAPPTGKEVAQTKGEVVVHS